MVRPHSPDAIGPYDQYGYGWVVVKSGSAFWHAGGISQAFASVVFVDEQHDVVVVALSNDHTAEALIFDGLFGFERDARDRARGFAWALPIGAAIALVASCALLCRLALDLRRRERVLAFPTLRRLVVFAVLPAAAAYAVWRQHVPMPGFGSPRIDATIVSLRPLRLLALTAVFALLASCAAQTVAPRTRERDSGVVTGAN